MLSMFLKGKFVQREILYISTADDKRRVPERSKNDAEISPKCNKVAKIFLATTQKSLTVEVFFFCLTLNPHAEMRETRL